MVDYIIIGAGLAGISFAETALRNGRKILVIDSGKDSSSKVAAGLYNPVILKRFTPVWDAQNQLLVLNNFYNNLESKLDRQFDFKIPILRKFCSIEEQNNWYIASDKIELAPFLSTELRLENFSGIDSPFDFGEVMSTGYVDVSLLLKSYRRFLEDVGAFAACDFDYSALVVQKDMIHYNDIIARHVIFAEGFGMNHNPFFNNLPLDGVKGELFIIKAPLLDLDVIVNTSVFILPLGDHLFKVGATYNWTDKTSTPTQEGKQELIDRIKEILTCEFEIISHYAGVRPTVKDRKPLVGTHPEFKNIHVLNGLGTRGVMLGPSMAKALFEFIEDGVPLVPEININRFRKK
jgi:glycine/D-amino acid oxidase-like deaminating enzyme